MELPRPLSEIAEQRQQARHQNQGQESAQRHLQMMGSAIGSVSVGYADPLHAIESAVRQLQNATLPLVLTEQHANRLHKAGSQLRAVSDILTDVRINAYS
jgi:hypothetical protein